MDHHSQKRPDDNARVNVPHRAFFLPALYVSADKLIYPFYEFVEKSFGKFMRLEGGIEQQPHECLIRLLFRKGIQREIVKDRVVITLRDRLLKSRVLFPGETHPIMALLVIEDRVIDVALLSKMAEHHRFRDARRFGDLFCGGPAKAVLRKQLDGRYENL